ncbi:uncharacterized protein B0I36DRAFT_99753 [Microdochium trichocladiopsis]|uniref:Uncharacterized protein n=1 Tax=Microdochium trichocladiopsis TaxID=1682393 RepID=A0A9P8Y5Z2_9PEZI|nr:uncharacterized protein B0I36DRAFT_99753 [Microdochium trichocladiopsis]KAH7032700.1 hypothetical protein B0I36DRAFT_99753 [Microdochium trichocladiopsis]
MMATDIRLFTRRPRSVLSPRDEGEHVVLADCRTKDLVYSSQMAYFNTTLDNSPEDIAVVKTAQGQTAVWFGQSTSALFTATGTTFKAVLNGTAEDGDFVGTGDNGYGTFYCYQNFYQDQYMYGDSTCNMVVDCNHRVPCSCNANPFSINYFIECFIYTSHHWHQRWCWCCLHIARACIGLLSVETLSSQAQCAHVSAGCGARRPWAHNRP